MRSIIGLLFVISGLAFVGCQSSGFDDGHEWIVPRPATEIQLSVLDATNEPLSGAVAWVLFGDQTINSAESFINYDPVKGYVSDAAGQIVIQYLGEPDGGYEVPLNAPAQPKLELRIEHPNGTELVFNLDTVLFGSGNRLGDTTLEHNGKSVAAKQIAYSIAFE
jgi:hypothetical protein